MYFIYVLIKTIRLKKNDLKKRMMSQEKEKKMYRYKTKQNTIKKGRK